MIQFCIVLPYVGALAVVDEAKAASCLGRLLVRGVRVPDALCAAEAVAHGILRHAYPEVINLLLQQQREGHETVLLSGNIEPLLSVIGARLQCRVVGTKIEVVRGRYTGNIVGPVCVLEGKRQKLLECMHPSQKARAPAERAGLIGVGNSVYDVPFLSEVPQAWVVRPSRRLRRIAEDKGWDLSLARVRGSGAEVSGAGLRPRRRLFQVWHGVLLFGFFPVPDAFFFPPPHLLRGRFRSCFPRPAQPAGAQPRPHDMAYMLH